MPAKLAIDHAQRQNMANALRSWMMVVLTLVFVLLYSAALLGWVKPLTDERVIGRLEPIIFVIIGYYFGRLPSQQNEKTLKDEINRQTQKADAAQHAKEQAQQARESLEEKIKNVRAALLSSGSGIGAKSYAESNDKASPSAKEDGLRKSIAAAVNILNS
jgi:hypothetical protein